jgi:hypothetical protein
MILDLSKDFVLSSSELYPLFGYEAENKAAVVTIRCESLQADGTYYLDIEQDGMRSQALLTSDLAINTLSLSVTAGMLGKAGTTRLQVVLHRESEVIVKSNTLPVQVKDSINAQELTEDFVPSEFEQFRASLEEKVRQVPVMAEEAMKDYLSDNPELELHSISNLTLERILK